MIRIFELISAGCLIYAAILALYSGLTTSFFVFWPLMSILFALCTQLFMQAGRAAAAGILGTPPAVCLGFFTTDALSALFTMVIVWIARRLDGIFEDQKKYLLRVQEEKERGDHS